jgi:hypothetical protein
VVVQIDYLMNCYSGGTLVLQVVLQGVVTQWCYSVVLRLVFRARLALMLQ